jgi:hypothetical protein
MVRRRNVYFRLTKTSGRWPISDIELILQRTVVLNTSHYTDSVPVSVPVLGILTLLIFGKSLVTNHFKQAALRLISDLQRTGCKFQKLSFISTIVASASRACLGLQGSKKTL